MASPSDPDFLGNSSGSEALVVPADRPYPKSPYDNFRKDRDEVENVLMLPCGVYLYLAIGMRTRLRRWIGRKAGSVIGTFVILVFAGPPIVFGCVTVVLFRLVFWSLGMLDKVRAVRTNS